MSQHTPGPWRLDLRHNSQAIVDANGKDLAYQDTHPRFLNGEPCGSVTSKGRTAEELAANALLIAAAPQLLDTMKGLVALCLAADVYGDAVMDAGLLLDKLGVPRDFYRTEDSQP